MENDLMKWQDLWQQKKASQFDIDKLAIRLLKLERITKFQRILLLLASAFALYAMLTRLSLNSYNAIAIVIIVIAVLFLLVPLFKNRLIRANVPNEQYINNRIKYLKGKLLIPRLYYLIFILLFVVALNIAFFGAFKQEPSSQRTLFHLSTILLLIVLLILRKIGIRNYENEILPLIDKFENLKNQE